MDSTSRPAPAAGPTPAAVSCAVEARPATARPSSVAEVMSPRELTLLVYRQMRAFAGPHRDLEDLAQTALEQVLQADFRGQAKISTFTHAVCYHVWTKHLRFTYRFRSRFVAAEDDLQASDVETSDPASLLQDRRRLIALYEVLERVSVKRRAVVTLHDVVGLDVPEIAQIVAANEATVRTRLRDGRKRLRALLARHPEFASADDALPANLPEELPCPQS